MKIQIHNKFNKKIIDDWLVLEKNSFCTPFQSLEWHKTWYDNIGINLLLDLFIISVEIEDKIIAIFPFCLEKKYFSISILWLVGMQTD